MEPQAELWKVLDDLEEIILDLAPDVRVEIDSAIYEDEHVNLTIYPPLTWSEDQCVDLQERIGEHLVELHLETGYFILSYVLTPEQQIAEAKQTIHQAQQRVRAAEQVLSEAATLGLLSQPVEVVPV
jgi:hypothetical protein